MDWRLQNWLCMGQNMNKLTTQIENSNALKAMLLKYFKEELYSENIESSSLDIYKTVIAIRLTSIVKKTWTSNDELIINTVIFHDQRFSELLEKFNQEMPELAKGKIHNNFLNEPIDKIIKSISHKKIIIYC